MSRTVAAQEADDDSFAGLLERLTQRQKSDHPDTNAVAGTRPLAPIRELKSMRNITAADTVELSYERALQRHARHKSTDELAIYPADLPASTAPPQKSKPKASPHNGQTPLKSESTQSAKAIPSKVRPKSSQPIPETRAASPHKAYRRPSHRQATEEVSHPSRKRQGGGTLAASSPHERRKKTGPNPPGKTNHPATTAPLASSQNNRVKASKSKPVVEPTESTLPVLRQENPNSPVLEHRRSIISVRLSEEELTRLRDRASESGITVSAYMRSCVLEAEHLRSQVKQALAEMRACARPVEPAHTSAWTRSVQSTLEHGGVWSRFAARSATFFLGLWFPFRREGRLQVQHEKSLLR